MRKESSLEDERLLRMTQIHDDRGIDYQMDKRLSDAHMHDKCFEAGGCDKKCTSRPLIVCILI